MFFVVVDDMNLVSNNVNNQQTSYQQYNNNNHHHVGVDDEDFQQHASYSHHLNQQHHQQFEQHQHHQHHQYDNKIHHQQDYNEHRPSLLTENHLSPVVQHQHQPHPPTLNHASAIPFLMPSLSLSSSSSSSSSLALQLPPSTIETTSTVAAELVAETAAAAATTTMTTPPFEIGDATANGIISSNGDVGNGGVMRSNSKREVDNSMTKNGFHSFSSSLPTQMPNSEFKLENIDDYHHNNDEYECENGINNGNNNIYPNNGFLNNYLTPSDGGNGSWLTEQMIQQHQQQEFQQLQSQHLQQPQLLQPQQQQQQQQQMLQPQLLQPQLVQQSQQFQNNPKPFPCDICGKTFGRVSHVRRHKLLHTGEKPYECPICQEKFTRVENRTRHMAVHTGDRRFKCKICDKGFSQLNRLIVHMRIHTGDRPYVCEICGKGFGRPDHKTAHMKIHLKHEMNSAVQAQQQYQHQNYQHQQQQLQHHFPQQQHQQQNRQEEYSKSPIDPLQIKEEFINDNEIITTTTPPPPPISTTKKQIDDNHQLLKIMSNQNLQLKPIVEKPFKCVICGKSFARKDHLNRHIPIHFKEKIKSQQSVGAGGGGAGVGGGGIGIGNGFGIGSLKQNFYSINNDDDDYVDNNVGEINRKERHLTENDDDNGVGGVGDSDPLLKPMVDDNLLSKQLINQLPLQQQQQLMGTPSHLSLLSSQTNDKPYACPICGKPFARKDHLTRHILIHSGEKPYECDICTKTFSRKDNKHKHMIGCLYSNFGIYVRKESEPDDVDEFGFPVMRTLEYRIHEKLFDIEQGKCIKLNKKNPTNYDMDFNQQWQNMQMDFFNKLPESKDGSMEIRLIENQMKKERFNKKQQQKQKQQHSEDDDDYDDGDDDDDDDDDVDNDNGDDLEASTLNRNNSVHLNGINVIDDDEYDDEFNEDDGFDINGDICENNKPKLELKIRSIGELTKPNLLLSSSSLSSASSSLSLSCETDKVDYNTSNSRRNSRSSNENGTGSGNNSIIINNIENEQKTNEIFNHINENEKKNELNHNNKSKGYPCDQCDRIYKYRNHLARHYLIHCDEKPFKCDQCDESFYRKDHLQRHVVKHTGIKPHKCNFCTKSFYSVGEQLRHIVKHVEMQKDDGDNDLSELTSQNITNDAIEVITGNNTITTAIADDILPGVYKCDQCDKVFSRKLYLKRHCLVHAVADGKPFKCDICDQGFSRLEHKKRHQTVHTQEKRYECDFCDKRFSRPDHMLAHIKTHDGVLPYKCNQCSKRFLTSKEKLEHARTHTGAYRCEMCYERFEMLSELSEHRQLIHLQKELVKSEILVGKKEHYPCPICHKYFNIVQLGDHVKNHISPDEEDDNEPINNIDENALDDGRNSILNKSDELTPPAPSLQLPAIKKDQKHNETNSSIQRRSTNWQADEELENQLIINQKYNNAILETVVNKDRGDLSELCEQNLFENGEMPIKVEMVCVDSE